MYNDNSTTIGNIGETRAIAEFTKRGYLVSAPFGNNAPYDLIIDDGQNLYKIQCKTTQKVHNDSVMCFSINSTNGFTGKHKIYTKNDIDLFCLHCLENDYVGIIPVEETNKVAEISIRLTPPKNNQANKVHMSEDYNIDVQLQKLQQKTIIKPIIVLDR